MCAHSVIVNVVGTDGSIGYGEGCPRAYVTAEESDASFEFLRSNQTQLEDISSLEELRSCGKELKNSIDHAPAAWCAFELAFLDLLGKTNNKTIDQLLELSELRGPFEYSAILGIQSPDAFSRSVQQYLKLKMSDFKLKVSGVISEDCARVEILKAQAGPVLGDRMRLRIDANNHFSNPPAVCQLVEALPFRPWAIEEPLVERTDFAAMQQIAQRLETKVILDESLCSIETVSLLPKSSDCWIANVRVSKCGGLLRSIELVRALLERGIGVIVGAHVGETSILTRAALSLVNAYRSEVIAQEGAFGTYLLSTDLVATPLMFGQGGVLRDHTSFKAAGLGLL